MAMLDKIMEDRRAKVAALKKAGQDPFATKSGRTQMVSSILSDYDKFEGKEVTVAGRMMFWREFGKIAFAKLRDESGDIQLYFSKEKLADKWDLLKLFDVGDFVDAKGIVIRTKTNEISVEVSDLSILTKSIRPLPAKWEGLKDVELRYRNRYLDILLNAETKKRLLARAGIERAIREFLWEKGFVEVTCPVLQPTYGGANAKPFKTHFNAIDLDVYLAISNELYLKRAIVGGIENVFTIGKLFRNEGVDKSHYPEFSMLETMSAYNNYEYNMDLLEEMYKYIARKVFGKSVFNIGGQEVNFEQPWKRVKMVDLVKEETGVDFDKLTLEQANTELKKVKLEACNSVGEALVEFMESQVGPKLIQPTVVFGHPVEVSPLCKRMPDDPKYVERFELYLGGIETGDNWSELNDPDELQARFEEEAEKKKKGNEETHPMDMAFVEAMQYGMPPTTGLGPGIERLAMMMSETENIDDVIWFPVMKPESTGRHDSE